MTDTANLGLPCIEGSQAQKHITHNDALRILDTLVQLAVLDRDLTAPPGSASEGQRWIVKAAATGAWAGHDNAIAAWQDGTWQFSTPQTGWLAYAVDEGALLAWSGSAWVDAMAALTSLNNMTLLGVGTAADATNPFSAKLNNILWVAKSIAESGDGDLRWKMSKESAANTLSMLFQDNYSGRAEIGLIGDDDFHFKVSPDGSTWHDGIAIDRNTGEVTLPNTTIAGGRETLTADRTYYVRVDGSDSNDGLTNSSGGAFLTIQKAIDTALTIDLAGYAVTVQVGAGTYSDGVLLSSPFVGGNVSLIGDTATPSNVIISTTGNCIEVSQKAVLTLGGFKLVSSAGYGIYAISDAVVTVSGKMEYGACGVHHIAATTSAIYITADYTISGNAHAHFSVIDAGLISAYGLTITLIGTPAFSSPFAYAARLGDIVLVGNTYSGSATGARYSVNQNSVIASGVTLPGSAAGSAASGGQYS